MKELLKTLSDYQVEAMDKGIDFIIDVRQSRSTNITAAVEMQYVKTGAINKTCVLNTTFSESLSEDKKQKRLDSIKHFIQTVTE